jgi:hypothetical protein
MLWLAWLGLSLPALAHEGAPHAEPAPVVGTSENAHVLGATGDVFEVVLKHPEHAVGAKTPVRLFVAEASTNAPVSGAQVELALTGARTQALTPKMEAPGTYVVDAELSPGAEWAAVATVTRGDQVDVLALGTVHVDPEEEHDEGRSQGASKPVVIGVGASALLVAVAASRALRRKKGQP